MSIGVTVFGKASVIDRFDPVPDRWFTRSSWFTFLICRPYGHQSCNQAQVFASHYSALRSRSGVALEGKGTGAWHSGKKWLSCTTA